MNECSSQYNNLITSLLTNQISCFRKLIFNSLYLKMNILQLVTLFHYHTRSLMSPITYTTNTITINTKIVYKFKTLIVLPSKVIYQYTERDHMSCPFGFKASRLVSLFIADVLTASALTKDTSLTHLPDAVRFLLITQIQLLHKRLFLRFGC